MLQVSSVELFIASRCPGSADLSRHEHRGIHSGRARSRQWHECFCQIGGEPDNDSDSRTAVRHCSALRSSALRLASVLPRDRHHPAPLLCARQSIDNPGYPVTFFACARNFAHRFLLALLIFALAAADITRFFTVATSRPVESPKAFAAARIPVSWCCSLPNCFSTFLSSRLIAARMSMNPPHEIYLKPKVEHQTYCERQLTRKTEKPGVLRRGRQKLR
jgi:hypothetical protein